MGVCSRYEQANFSAFIGYHRNHWVIVNPQGHAGIQFFSFLDELLLYNGSDKHIFFKKVDRHMRDELKPGLDQHGYVYMGSAAYPWDSLERDDDDSYPERIVDTRKAVDGLCSPGKASSKLRQKLRVGLALLRNMEILRFSPENRQQVAEMLHSHFENETHYCEAYEPMLAVLCGNTCKDRIIGTIAVSGGQVKAFFAYEILDRLSAGLYASVADRKMAGLSEAMHYYIFKNLRDIGVNLVNLGGSERKSLDRFKSKFPGGSTRQFKIFSISRSVL